MKCLIFIALIAFYAPNQHNISELLIGKWEGYKMDKRNGDTGEDITLDGKPYTTETILEFYGDGKGYDYDSDTYFRYFIENNIILMGNRFWEIEKITEEELILVEYDLEYGPSEFDFRSYFRKVKKS